MPAELPRQTLGRTGLEVTQYSLGGMDLRGVQRRSDSTDEAAERVLNAVLDQGINFIDTAPDYGESEERIGKYISHRRDEFYLATKCGCNIGPQGGRQEPSHVWTADRLRRNIDQSLERMKTDYVDVLQMHNPSVEEVEQNVLVEVLQEIKAAGKTRFIGVSSTAPDLLPFARLGVFDTFQVPYSVLQREHERMIQEAAAAGAGIIIRGGVAKGIREGSPFAGKWNEAHLEDLIGEMSPYEFMVRFTLTHPACHTAIVGTVNPDHLAANIAAAKGGPLPPDLYEQVKVRMAEIGEVPED